MQESEEYDVNTGHESGNEDALNRMKSSGKILRKTNQTTFGPKDRPQRRKIRLGVIVNKNSLAPKDLFEHRVELQI